MNRLRAPALRQKVKTLEARRAGPLDSRELVKHGHARNFPFHGVMRGKVRHARFPKRNCYVDMIGGERLGLARLARSIFRPRSNFRPAIAGVSRGQHNLPRDSANRRRGGREGFSLATGRAKQHDT